MSRYYPERPERVFSRYRIRGIVAYSQFLQHSTSEGTDDATGGLCEPPRSRDRHVLAVLLAGSHEPEHVLRVADSSA